MSKKISYFPTCYQSWKTSPGSFFFFLAFIAKPCLSYLQLSIAINPLFIPYFFLCFLLPMEEETSDRILLNQPKTTTHFDNPTLQTTTEKVNGHNYLEQFQSAKIFLKSRGKMGFSCGTIKEPKQSDSSFESWDAENSMIMSWLLNSMQSEIGKHFCLCLRLRRFGMLCYKHTRRKEMLLRSMNWRQLSTIPSRKISQW